MKKIKKIITNKKIKITMSKSHRCTTTIFYFDLGEKK